VVIFNDENSEKMAECGRAILDIAKANHTKIITPVVFK
jgi:hypothetical protein